MSKESSRAIDQIDDVNLSIIDAIGEDAFEKLCNVVGGQTVYFVTQKCWTRAGRNKSIYERYKAGATYAQLATTYRLSGRYIYAIIKQMDTDEQKFVKIASQLGRLQLDMIDAIGMDNFTKLVERFGGSLVYISKGERMKIPSRNKEIAECVECGETYKKIAKRYRLTERHVREIVKQYNAGDENDR